MRTIKTKVSDVEVLIQVDDSLSINNEIATNPLEDTRRTSAKLGGAVTKATDAVVENILETASKIIFAFADICKAQSEKQPNTPDELDVEYALSLDLSSNLWVITSGANSTIKVNMKWKKD